MTSAANAADISRLPNGLTVITDPRPGAAVTAVQLWVKAGSIDEAEQTLGLSHFMEHMLFKGTTTRDVGNIHAEVERNGGDMNAATSDDWTYYHITIPSSEWKMALDLLLDIAVNATFPDSEVTREREVIKEEIARRDDNPEALLYDNLGRAAYKVHPYRWRVIGNDTSLDRITRPVFLDFYRRHYVPWKQAIVLVGDFDTAHVARRVAETLGRIPRRKVRPDPARPTEPPTKPEELVVPAQTQLAYGAVSYPAPSAKDLLANVAGDILGDLLTAPGSGRLMKNLVESKRIADAVEFSFPTSRDPARFSITYTAPPANRAAIEEEIRKELRILVADGVTAAELSGVIDRMKRGRRLRNESSASRAFNLGFWFVVTRPEDADAYERALDTITPRDIDAFAKRYLDDRRSVTVVVEPAAISTGSDVLAETAITWRPHAGELASVGLFFTGGQSLEPRPGWAASLSGVMARGVAGKTNEEFERDLASLGLTVSASAAPDLFSVIGTCEPSRAGLLVNTLFDVVTNPNMADLEIVRESLLDSLRGRADRPFETGLDKLNALRFPGHPYGRPDAGDETGVRAAGVEALQEYLKTLHIRDRLRVVVVGSADTAMIRRAVAERISAWPPAADLPLPIPEPVSSGVVTDLAPTAQTIVLRSVAAPPVSDPDYPKWKVANAILGGRSASRLFRIIREERGLAYAVGSFYATRRLGAHLVFYAGCRPQFAAQVRAHYPEALYPPTPAEMDDAIRSLTGDFARDHERVERRAWYLGWYAAIGLDASYDEDFPDAIRGVTISDVDSVFEKVRSAPAIDLTYGAAPAPDPSSETKAEP